MAKKKKTAEPSDLKELLWRHVMRYGGNLDEAFGNSNDNGLGEKLKRFTESTMIEVPAFEMSLHQIQELRDSISVDDGLEGALDAAMKHAQDEVERLAYHEREMLRHTAIVEKLNKTNKVSK